MTTTDAERDLLNSLQILRTLDYPRYADMLRVITAWVQSENKRLMPSGREKVIDFEKAAAAHQ